MSAKFLYFHFPDPPPVNRRFGLKRPQPIQAIGDFRLVYLSS